MRILTINVMFDSGNEIRGLLDENIFIAEENS